LSIIRQKGKHRLARKKMYFSGLYLTKN